MDRLFETVERRFGGLGAPMEELTCEQWRRTVDTNPTGTFLCARQASAS